MATSDDARLGAVKRARCPAGCWHSIVAITILLIPFGFGMWTTAALGSDRLGSSRYDRPPPHVTRQVDRLSRDGSADPLTRRQLQDQLRREPPSAGRSSAERTLEHLPVQEPPAPRTLPTSPELGELPSSLPAGIEGAGGGGFVAPPGNRGQLR